MCIHIVFYTLVHVHIHMYTYIYIYIYYTYTYIHKIHTFILNITCKQSCFFQFRFLPPPLLFLLFSPHCHRRLLSPCCFCPHFATFGLVLPPLFSFCRSHCRATFAHHYSLLGCHNYVVKKIVVVCRNRRSSVTRR